MCGMLAPSICLAGKVWQKMLLILGSGCVAQLVEWSLPIPEVRGSNPVIGKILLNICLLSTVYWNDENKEKEAGNGPSKKKLLGSGTVGHF